MFIVAVVIILFCLAVFIIGLLILLCMINVERSLRRFSRPARRVRVK